MTVCIAAICQTEVKPPRFIVVGATDLKITSGDIQYEPRMPKIRELGYGMVALIAGDAAAQNEICNDTVAQQPVYVRQAVDIYCRQTGEHNRRQAEQRILYPLGLDMQAFLADAVHMQSELHAQLAHDISRVRAGVETIISGIDQVGTHLYTIDSTGTSTCDSAIGFTAIGDGYYHAQSQFMFARHTPFFNLSQTLMLTYAAKKRAEVAKGVGKKTVMFFITPERGFKYMDESVIDELKKAYGRMRKAQSKELKNSYAAIQSYFDQALKAQESPKVEAPPDEPPTPPAAS